MNNEEKILAMLEKHSAMLEAQNAKLDKHSAILEKHGAILEKHSAILEKHSAILEKHGAILESHGTLLIKLVNKVDALEQGQIEIKRELSDISDLTTTIAKEVETLSKKGTVYERTMEGIKAVFVN